MFEWYDKITKKYFEHSHWSIEIEEKKRGGGITIKFMMNSLRTSDYAFYSHYYCPSPSLHHQKVRDWKCK